MDARVNTADDSSTSDKNFVNFGPVTLSFAGALTATGGLHAGLFHAFLVMYRLVLAVVQRIERWTCDQRVAGSNPTLGKCCVTTLGKLFTQLHTYVPLSRITITWYRPRGGDAVRLGR